MKKSRKHNIVDLMHMNTWYTDNINESNHLQLIHFPLKNEDVIMIYINLLQQTSSIILPIIFILCVYYTILDLPVLIYIILIEMIGLYCPYEDIFDFLAFWL